MTPMTREVASVKIAQLWSLFGESAFVWPSILPLLTRRRDIIYTSTSSVCGCGQRDLQIFELGHPLLSHLGHQRQQAHKIGYGSVRSFEKNSLMTSTSLIKPMKKSWSCPLCSMTAKFFPSRRFVLATSELSPPRCQQHASHQHRPQFTPQHHFR